MKWIRSLAIWVWTTNITIVVVAACTHQPQGPYAVVRLQDPAAWSKDDLHWVEAGVVAWQGLGFVPRLEDEPEVPLCPNDWYKRRPQVTRCMIRIGVKRERGLMLQFHDMGQANRETDTIAVDSSLTRFDLIHVVAHELGHILLNTLRHTTKGVMVGGGWEWSLSDQDRALACETIGRGCP